MGAGDLISSFFVDPANIMQGGVGNDSRIILIQKADLGSYIANGIDVITAITLVVNKTAFIIEGVRQSMKPSFEVVKTGSGLSVFKHSIEFHYFDYAQTSKNNAARIAQGRYVVAIENAKLDANTFELYGLDVGLEVMELKRANQENDGAIKILLASPENENEAKPPRTFDAGTGIPATNRTALEALVFLPTIGVAGLSIVTYVAATPTAIVITGTNFFGGGANSAVLGVALVNNLTGAVIPFVASLTVAATTITTTTPVAVALNNYRVRVTTTRGVIFSSQNIVTT